MRSPEQAGQSLTETLIGLSLGLSVLMLAWQAWASLRWTVQSLRAVASWEQHARPWSALLQQLTDQAGSGSLQTPWDQPARLSPSLGLITGADGTGTQSDHFSLTQERSLFGADCQGNSIAGPAALTNQFKISSKFELTCKDTQRAGSLFQALAERVEDLQVQYVQRSGSLTQPRLQWRTASQVTDWSRVQGAEFCLRLASSTKLFQGSAEMTGCQGERVAQDGRYRQEWREVLRFSHAAP